MTQKTDRARAQALAREFLGPRLHDDVSPEEAAIHAVDRVFKALGEGAFTYPPSVQLRARKIQTEHTA
jgi:hypothetical protein